MKKSIRTFTGCFMFTMLVCNAASASVAPAGSKNTHLVAITSQVSGKSNTLATKDRNEKSPGTPIVA